MTGVRGPAAVVLLLAAATASGFEGDPPPVAPTVLIDAKAARALAEKALDEARGEKGRELYRLVLPTEDPTGPETGSEVVLIGGYISNYVVVYRWTGTEVEVARLSMARTWFYNPAGERWSSAAPKCPAAEFARLWGAARLMIGASVERKTPRDPSAPFEGGGMGGGSHTPEAWIRIRAPGREAPLFLENRTGSSWDGDGVSDFDLVRAQALFRLFDGLAVLHAKQAAPLPLEAWRPFVRGNLERFCKSPLRLGEDDVPLSDRNLLLVEVCLRALSEAGETTDSALIDRVDARIGVGLESAKSDDYGLRSARQEIPLAQAKIRLRWEWDATEAAKAIHENPRKLHAQNDLAAWIRDRYHEKDPKGYREMLLADVRSKDRLLLRETIREIGRRLPTEAPELLAPFRKSDDEAIREAVEEALKPPK